MRTSRARRIVLASAALVAFVFVAACGPAPEPPPPPPERSSPAAADNVAQHNYARGLHGLGALSVDGGMQANAQFHANRLAAGATACTTGALWHSPELGAWYPRVSAGENVACVPGCPTDGGMAFTMWMNSPGHRDNVLGPDFTRIGLATKCNGSVQMVVAQYRSG